MLKVTEIHPKFVTLDYLDISWEIGPVAAPVSGDLASHEIYDYDFYVLRSVDSEAGPYEAISGPLRDVYEYRDSNVRLQNRWRRFFYKIRVLNRVTGEQEEFGPASHDGPPPDLIASEIIRQESILLREMSGRLCWVFFKRTFGPYCSCYDLDMGRKSRSNHGPCFGTGLLGGYIGPAECYIQFDPNAEQDIRGQFGKTQVIQTSGRTIAHPRLKPGDVIVESTGNRWRVTASRPTERLRAPVHQELQMQAIARGDVEYMLEVGADTDPKKVASYRNFNLRTHLDEDEYQPPTEAVITGVPNTDGEDGAVLMDYVIPRGSDWVVQFEYEDESYDSVPMAGWTAELSIFSNEDLLGTPIGSLSTEGGEIVLGASDGSILITFSESLIASFAWSDAFYRLTLIPTSEDEIVLMSGRITLKE